MKKLIIGCDPDVDGKGFAIYEDGVLSQLITLSLIELQYFINSYDHDSKEIQLHIEDMHSNRACWQKGGSGAARKVGRCEQMQLEVEKVAAYFNIKIVRYPVSSQWKNAAGKKEFERVTGWTGRSNEDTRSAAYFGYLGVLG
jgi:hypothetical protein